MNFCAHSACVRPARKLVHSIVPAAAVTVTVAVVIVVVVVVAILPALDSWRAQRRRMRLFSDFHLVLHAGPGLGAPMRMITDPDINALHPDRVADDPNMLGAPIIILVAIPAHVFVAVPETIIGDEPNHSHAGWRWRRPVISTTGGQTQDCHAGSRQGQGNFARGFHTIQV